MKDLIYVEYITFVDTQSFRFYRSQIPFFQNLFSISYRVLLFFLPGFSIFINIWGILLKIKQQYCVYWYEQASQLL